MPGYKTVRPLIFLLRPEFAHDRHIQLLSLWPASRPKPPDPILRSTVAGLEFPSPVGLAAGFDKNAQAPVQLLGLGFGSVEVGTLTPRPQKGNAKPRLFRLMRDDAIVNRMGFNNGGLEAAIPRIQAATGAGIVGVNIGANKATDNKIDDYVEAYAAAADSGSYVTLNISSPNTPGLRNLQAGGALVELLSAISSGRRNGKPLFLKVAPDLDYSAIAVIGEACARFGVDGIIVSNTTISRPDELRSRRRRQTGGLSGRPLKELALDMLRAFRRELGTTIPLIGAGGIFDAQDAYERIRAGASLVQLYTALAYEGPGLARRINAGLVNLLQRDGFASIADAVGIDGDRAPVTRFAPAAHPRQHRKAPALHAFG